MDYLRLCTGLLFILISRTQDGTSADSDVHPRGLSSKFADNRPYLPRKENSTLSFDIATGKLLDTPSTGKRKERVVSSVRLLIQVINGTAYPSNGTAGGSGSSGGATEDEEEESQGRQEVQLHHTEEASEADAGGDSASDADDDQIQQISDESGESMSVILVSDDKRRPQRYPSTKKNSHRASSTTASSLTADDVASSDSDDAEEENEISGPTGHMINGSLVDEDDNNGEDLPASAHEHPSTSDASSGEESESVENGDAEEEEEEEEPVTKRPPRRKTTSTTTESVDEEEVEREHQDSELEAEENADCDCDEYGNPLHGDSAEHHGGKESFRFSDWTKWTACKPVNRTHSVRERVRFKLLSDTDSEPEMKIQTEACESSELALIPGFLSQWSGWSGCSSTCDSGVQTRFRALIGPAIYRDGMDHDALTETRACELKKCIKIVETPALLGEWTPWSSCSRTCDEGIRTRYRRCVLVSTAAYVSYPDLPVTERVHLPKPHPTTRERCLASHIMPTEGIQTRPCELAKCIRIVETPTFLDEWSKWSPCSRSCGGGLRTRYQQCLLVSSAQYVSHPDVPVVEEVAIPEPRAVPRRRCTANSSDPTEGIESSCCAAILCPGEESIVDDRYAAEVLYPGKLAVAEKQQGTGTLYTTPSSYLTTPETSYQATTISYTSGRNTAGRLMPSEDVSDKDYEELSYTTGRPHTYLSSTLSPHYAPPVQQQYAPPPVQQQYVPPPVQQQYAPPPVQQQYVPPPVQQQYAPPVQQQLPPAPHYPAQVQQQAVAPVYQPLQVPSYQPVAPPAPAYPAAGKNYSGQVLPNSPAVQQRVPTSTVYPSPGDGQPTTATPTQYNYNKTGTVVQRPIVYDVSPPSPAPASGPSVGNMIATQPKVLCVSLNSSDAKTASAVQYSFVNGSGRVLPPAVLSLNGGGGGNPSSAPVSVPATVKAPEIVYPPPPAPPVMSIQYSAPPVLVVEPPRPVQQAPPSNVSPVDLPMVYQVRPPTRYEPMATAAPLDVYAARRYQEENQVDYDDYEERH
ncbi:hypothetical protein BV898_15478 [Hypsibius exemplaris]|uniref:Uncharacterized protein n=1 Tax=Hypsibius exemplaris TaxID=2072580 RepID=A0A9X6RKI5_HYPEX|nr:hypothetical protein BV898_15478 [Hypsibius exemplaris]